MQELEQSFSALTPRDKMRFLRWAAESVGARLEIDFSAVVVKDSVDLKTYTPKPGGVEIMSNDPITGRPVEIPPQFEMEIPEDLKRKK